MHGSRGTEDEPPQGVPCFGAYWTSMDAAAAAAGLLRSAALSLIFDLDETLLMARSLSQLQREHGELVVGRRPRAQAELTAARKALSKALVAAGVGDAGAGEGEAVPSDPRLRRLVSADAEASASSLSEATAMSGGGVGGGDASSAREGEDGGESGTAGGAVPSTPSPPSAETLAALRASVTAAETTLACLAQEEALIARDLGLVQSFAASDEVEWEGRRVRALFEEASVSEGPPSRGAAGSSTTPLPILRRPVIRLAEGDLVLTRIDPNVPATSMIFHIRPGWRALRPYLTGEMGAGVAAGMSEPAAAAAAARVADSCAPSAAQQHVPPAHRQYSVAVCTAARRDYALEAWRVLDPGARLIPLAERASRIVDTKAKDVPQVLGLPPAVAPLPKRLQGKERRAGSADGGAEAVPDAAEAGLPRLRGALPLALIVDDRTDVWAPEDRPQILQVEAFKPYEELAAAALGLADRPTPALLDAQMRQLREDIASLRGHQLHGAWHSVAPVLRGVCAGEWPGVEGEAKPPTPIDLGRPAQHYAELVPLPPWTGLLMDAQRHREAPPTLTVPGVVAPVTQALPLDPRLRGSGGGPPEKRARVDGPVIQLDPDLLSALVAMRGVTPPVGPPAGPQPGAQHQDAMSDKWRQAFGAGGGGPGGGGAVVPPPAPPPRRPQPPAPGSAERALLEAAKTRGVRLEYVARGTGGGYEATAVWDRRRLGIGWGADVVAAREAAAAATLRLLEEEGRGGGGRGGGRRGSPRRRRRRGCETGPGPASPPRPRRRRRGPRTPAGAHPAAGRSPAFRGARPERHLHAERPLQPRHQRRAVGAERTGRLGPLARRAGHQRRGVRRGGHLGPGREAGAPGGGAAGAAAGGVRRVLCRTARGARRVGGAGAREGARQVLTLSVMSIFIHVYIYRM